jgi:hypothetical protein
MEFRQIATSLALSEHDIAQTETETEDPNSYCDTFVPLHGISDPFLPLCTTNPVLRPCLLQKCLYEIQFHLLQN